MYQQPKSATTAGLLGIFLGSVGAHNWYLGEKSKGIAHVCMMSGGILVNILASLILPNIFSMTMLLQTAWLFTVLTGIAGLAMSASAIWGLVEGIMILTQGDAGLAAKGYPVAMPAQGVPMNNNYGQPMNNMNNGMNMGANSMGGMNGMNNMNNGMNMGANSMGGMNNMSNMGPQMNNGMSPQMNNMGGANYNSMPTDGATNGINNAGGANNDTVNASLEASSMQNNINSDAGQTGENTGSNNANDSNSGN